MYENVDKVICSSCHQKVDVMADKAGISGGSCHTILSKYLKMHCVCQPVVPRMLMQEQYDDCARIIGELHMIILFLKECHR